MWEREREFSEVGRRETWKSTLHGTEARGDPTTTNRRVHAAGNQFAFIFVSSLRFCFHRPTAKAQSFLPGVGTKGTPLQSAPPHRHNAIMTSPQLSSAQKTVLHCAFMLLSSSPCSQSSWNQSKSIQGNEQTVVLNGSFLNQI